MLRTAMFLCAANLAAPVGNAVAQAVVNPNTVQFTASPDHTALNSDGSAIVTSYELQFFLVGAAQPFQRASLGKPNPDATNNIAVSLASMVVGWPVPGTDYVAAVAAVGPGGVGVSGLSNTFSFTATGCTFTVSAVAQSASAAGGSQSVTVTTGTGCAWAVAANASWIAINGSGNRTGSGTVDYTVASNSGAGRTGTITLAGQTLTVSQAGACTLSVSPLTQSVTAAGGSQSATVTAGSGCSWSVASNSSWITVSGAASRTGGGTVNYTVASNSGASRSGSLAIAGQTLTVTQAGACTFSLSSTSFSAATSGGSGSTQVTTTSGCAWTVSNNVSWVTVSGARNRTGSGTVNFTVSANSGSLPRTGGITIAGTAFTVTQSGTSSAPSPPTNLRVHPA